MNNEDQFKNNSENFLREIRDTRKEMYEKLYANIPVAKDDPDYFKKANDYLNSLGIGGIMKLLGYDNVKEAKLIWEGIQATKYNHHTKQREPDLKTRLSYMHYVLPRVKQEKKEDEEQDNNKKSNIEYIPPDWFHPEKIAAKTNSDLTVKNEKD